MASQSTEKEVPRSQDILTYDDPTEAAEIFGLAKTRKMYEDAITDQVRVPNDQLTSLCLKYAELEKRYGEIDRARSLYKHASDFANPQTNPDFWNQWAEFEDHHGNEDTSREMLRLKRIIERSVQHIANS